MKERDFLRENNVVSETQCDLGLTALNLNDILDLMVNDYADKYSEFNDYLNELKMKRWKDALKAKHQTMAMRQRLLQQDTNAVSMENLIANTIKSAALYNSQLQKEKKSERLSFFDNQTMRIQEPQLRHHFILKQLKRYDDDDIITTNSKGPYPVALLTGQYQNYYKTYTPDELKHLPVNTITSSHQHIPTPILYQKWKRYQNRTQAQSKQVNKHKLI
jgi:BRG1-associated factor 45A